MKIAQKNKKVKKVPFPPRGSTPYEVVKFYDDIIRDKDPDDEQLRLIRSRLYRVDTYFNTEAALLKDRILICIHEMLCD